MRHKFYSRQFCPKSNPVCDVVTLSYEVATPCNEIFWPCTQKGNLYMVRWYIYITRQPKQSHLPICICTTLPGNPVSTSPLYGIMYRHGLIYATYSSIILASPSTSWYPQKFWCCAKIPPIEVSVIWRKRRHRNQRFCSDPCFLLDTISVLIQLTISNLIWSAFTCIYFQFKSHHTIPIPAKCPKNNSTKKSGNLQKSENSDGFWQGRSIFRKIRK